MIAKPLLFEINMCLKLTLISHKNPNFSIFGLKLTFFDFNGPTDPKNEFGTIKNFLEVHYYFFGSEKILGRAGHPHAGISAKKHPNFAVFGLKS